MRRGGRDGEAGAACITLGVLDGFHIKPRRKSLLDSLRGSSSRVSVPEPKPRLLEDGKENTGGKVALTRSPEAQPNGSGAMEREPCSEDPRGRRATPRRGMSRSAGGDQPHSERLADETNPRDSAFAKR